MHTRTTHTAIAAALSALLAATPALAQQTGTDDGATRPQDDGASATAQTDATAAGDTAAGDTAQPRDDGGAATAAGADVETDAAEPATQQAGGGDPTTTQPEDGPDTTTAQGTTATDQATDGADTTQAQTGDAATTGGGGTDQAETAGTSGAMQGTRGDQAQSADAEEMPQAAQQLDQLTEGGPGEAPGDAAATDEQLGQSVMLDVEAFSEALYERGYRQGYLRGVRDARMQMMRQMGQARVDRQPAPTQQGQPQGGGGIQGMQPERGAVVVLPPGVSPEAFIRRLQEGG